MSDNDGLMKKFAGIDSSQIDSSQHGIDSSQRDNKLRRVRKHHEHGTQSYIGLFENDPTDLPHMQPHPDPVKQFVIGEIGNIQGQSLMHTHLAGMNGLTVIFDWLEDNSRTSGNVSMAIQSDVSAVALFQNIFKTFLVVAPKEFTVSHKAIRAAFKTFSEEVIKHAPGSAKDKK